MDVRHLSRHPGSLFRSTQHITHEPACVARRRARLRLIMASYDKAGALLSAGELPPLKKLGEGKVRDLYEVDAERLLVVVTDRISAFDVIMLNGVKGKGKILNQLTGFWLRHLASNGLGIEHHMITDDVNEMPESCRKHAGVISGRSMLVRKLRMLPVESIVRGYITGSGWVDYQKSGTVCGHVLPSGLQLCDRLPEELFTPSTKAELGEHDENITVEQAGKIVGESRAQQVSLYARRVYTLAAAHAEPRGVLVADTKMEFGVCSAQSCPSLPAPAVRVSTSLV